MAPETPEPAPPVITISAPSASVAEGSSLKFMVRADPAPAADLTVGVRITPSGCELAQAPKSVTVSAGKTSATLTVPTSGASVEAEGCTVTAMISAGNGYRVGPATDASASATLTPAPVRPVVTIAPTASPVTEGSPVSFTLTAVPPPAAALTVAVSWSDPGSFLIGDRPRTVIIPASGTETLTAETENDGTDEPNGAVTVTVEAGSGYVVGTPDSASVDVTDDDTATTGGGSPPPAPAGPLVEVSVKANKSSINEGESVTFTVTALPVPTSDLTVNVNLVVNGGVAVSKGLTSVKIAAGLTVATVTLETINDDDPVYPPGTPPSGVFLSLAIRAGTGYTVKGSIAKVTVVDSD